MTGPTVAPRWSPPWTHLGGEVSKRKVDPPSLATQRHHVAVLQLALGDLRAGEDVLPCRQVPTPQGSELVLCVRWVRGSGRRN